jgi:hypothetical protein
VEREVSIVTVDVANRRPDRRTQAEGHRVIEARRRRRVEASTSLDGEHARWVEYRMVLFILVAAIAMVLSQH